MPALQFTWLEQSVLIFTQPAEPLRLTESKADAANASYDRKFVINIDE